MDWGLKNRLAHIIKPNDNRALMLAVDHGYFLEHINIVLGSYQRIAGNKYIELNEKIRKFSNTEK